MAHKIAICISGQIRNYNIDDYKIIDSIEWLFDREDFELDFYGHTWNDQEKPNNISKFKGFVQEDQDNIWNFAKKDLNKYVPYRQSWWEKQEYRDIINNEGNLVDFYKQRVKGGLGQVWSHHQCVRQISNVFDYDAIIRCRWDGQLVEWNSFNKKNDDNLEYTKTMVQDFINLRNDDFKTHGINGLCSRTFVAGEDTPFIGDHFFVFKPNTFMNQPVEEIFVNMQLKTKTHNSIFPVTHAGWYYYLRHGLNLKIAGVLPDVLDCNSKEHKPNKDWNI